MIVIDTHVLLWWANGATDRLSKPAHKALSQSEQVNGGIVVSAISAWEIALLVRKGKIDLFMDVDSWLNHAATLDGVTFDSIERDVLVQAVSLPDPFHDDPADRIIVATSRSLNIPLVTADAKILRYPHAKTIW